ncbi:MAG: MBL fold metallo-hydrolase [Clostridia bacterium]|nr:MBL fold metallo-hydrolase [Clostridia bacterium]
MAKRKRKTAGKKLVGTIVLLVAIISVILGRFNDSFETTPNININKETDDSVVKVHVIDVDNASATLVQHGETGVLIDAGEKKTANELVSYIKNTGVKKLSYVIASHPHSDHIGGIPTVLDSFEVGTVIMPKLSEINIPTTRVYENLLTSISEKQIKTIAAKYNYEFSLGSAIFKILGPLEQDEELNNMSVVLRMSCFDTDVVLPGDAESEALEKILSKKPSLKSEILIMPHHGSDTSYNVNFYKSVSPSIAAISCGKDNSYGHPHKKVTDYLDRNNIEYYRTDTAGNIIFTISPEGYSVESVY